MIAWKIVKRDLDNVYKSAIITGQALTFYELNKTVQIPSWLKSENFYPHLFDSMDSALNGLPYLSNYWDDGVFILKCKCKNKVPTRVCAPGLLSDGLITDTYNSVIKGTVSYKTIIPIKVLSIEEVALQSGFKVKFDTIEEIRSNYTRLTVIVWNHKSADTLVKKYLSNGSIAIVYDE